VDDSTLSHQRRTQLTDVVGRLPPRHAHCAQPSLTRFAAASPQGPELNRALAICRPPSSRDAAAALAATLPGALSGLVSDADRTMRGLAGDRPDDVSGLIRGAGATLETTASAQRALGAAIDRAPATLQQVDETLPVADPLLAISRGRRPVAPRRPLVALTAPALERLLARRRSERRREPGGAAKRAQRRRARALKPCARRGDPRAACERATRWPSTCRQFPRT